MSVEVFNRREIKYLIPQSEYEKLLPLILEHMDADKYNLNNQSYSIHNLYFDTKDDYLISTSIQKPVYKQKIRLRSYGVVQNDDDVYFEIKKKYKGIVNKRRTVLSYAQALDYLSKRMRPDHEKLNNQVFNELDYLFTMYPDLSPKVYLSYDRFAFYEKNNQDFRLTFDFNVKARRNDVSLCTNNFGTNLLDENIMIMEAKAFNAFPMWFVQAISKDKIKNVSFSKYGREYELFLKGKKS